MMPEHVLCQEQNDLIEIQIRTDALLSRQLQEEERDQALQKHKQAKYDVTSMHQVNRFQVKGEK